MAETKTPIRRFKSLQDKFEIPPSPLMKKIGFGTGVAVYELQRSPALNRIRSPWAVKKLIEKAKKNRELDKRLNDEAEVLRRLNHPNIVGFRAFAKDANGKSVLAMEECSSCLGDMIEDRLDNNKGPFPCDNILKVALDIAHALDYLHNQALLIHCDIKSYNVLIKGDFQICKLCDFGVCLPAKNSGEVNEDAVKGDLEYVGTNAWCPPEILDYPQVITTKADIYSYGLVIWEMIALTPPCNEETASSLSFEDSVIEVNDSFDDSEGKENCRKRPPLPDLDLGEEYEFILEIHYCCTYANKDLRPNAKNLSSVLTEYVKSKKK